MPARPYKPKDKAKVEVGVQIVERWILARLRHQTFFSLAELNQCIRALLTELNEHPFKQLPGNRCEAFEQLDRPALGALPMHPYRYVAIKTVKVNIDYHVSYEQHHYSVPHQYVSQQLELHAGDTLLQAYHQQQQVASHPRKTIPGMSTIPEHMPERHPRSQYRMGTLREEGLGAPRNRIHAYAWLSLAATEGMQEAVQARDELEAVMTKAEVKQAQKLSEHWFGKMSSTAKKS